jgi:hypothetical protein
MSLDGFIAGPHGEYDWIRSGEPPAERQSPQWTSDAVCCLKKQKLKD